MLPEQLQAQAVALERYIRALEVETKAATELRSAALEAKDAGVPVSHLAERAGVSRDKVKGWFKLAERERARQENEDH